MRVIIPLIAAALIFVGCEKSEDKAQEAATCVIFSHAC